MSNEINYAELYMKALGLSEEVIQKQNEGTILCSDSMEIVELHPELKNKLEELQQTYQDSYEFFHVINSESLGYPTIDFLCYSKNPEQAEYDMKFLKKGIILSYCWNSYFPDFPDFGHIFVEKINGTLKRKN